MVCTEEILEDASSTDEVEEEVEEEEVEEMEEVLEEEHIQEFVNDCSSCKNEEHGAKVEEIKEEVPKKVVETAKEVVAGIVEAARKEAAAPAARQRAMPRLRMHPAAAAAARAAANSGPRASPPATPPAAPAPAPALAPAPTSSNDSAAKEKVEKDEKVERAEKVESAAKDIGERLSSFWGGGKEEIDPSKADVMQILNRSLLPATCNPRYRRCGDQFAQEAPGGDREEHGEDRGSGPLETIFLNLFSSKYLFKFIFFKIFVL